MELINIGGRNVKVDIVGELSVFDWGKRVKWQEDKLIAPSPFRYEEHPSFFVNLTGEYAGTWKDSGSEFREFERGNLIKLLAFMRNETYEEAEAYLALKYGVEIDYDNLTLVTPNLSIEPKRKALPKDFMQPYMYRHAYLGNRGISEKVQRMMKVGYDPQTQSVVMPWVTPRGEIANCKFRRVNSKIFWYTKDALPIKHLVYGMNAVYGAKKKRAYLGEGEVDALTWLTLGKAGIAVGGANFTDVQADIIRRSPIEELVICADNDEQGRKLRDMVKQKLQYDIELYEIILPNGYKDINELHMAGLEPPEPTPINPFKSIKLSF